MSKIVVIAGGGTVGIRTIQELGKRGGRGVCDYTFGQPDRLTVEGAVTGKAYLSTRLAV
jgi:hypothetical protein